MKYLALLPLLFLGAAAAADERPCGLGDPCETASGEYHLAFPGGWDGTSKLPAVLFFHGFRSSGENVIKNKGLAAAFGKSGYLLIAPNGSSSPGFTAKGWPARPDALDRRDDIAFVSEVLDDVTRRLPLDRGRVLVSGFSSGGSMAWHLGCYAKERFAGFAPVAGGLRRPNPPEACPAGPMRVLHIHGFADQQVPLEGRAIRDWHQGDVFESLAILRTTNQCRSNPTRVETSGILECRIWDGCGSGRDIQFCLHQGGHNLPEGWSERVLKWFENGS